MLWNVLMLWWFETLIHIGVPFIFTIFRIWNFWFLDFISTATPIFYPPRIGIIGYLYIRVVTNFRNHFHREKITSWIWNERFGLYKVQFLTCTSFFWNGFLLLLSLLLMRVTRQLLELRHLWFLSQWFKKGLISSQNFKK